jgi:parallel beta-helix repeat protein
MDDFYIIYGQEEPGMMKKRAILPILPTLTLLMLFGAECGPRKPSSSNLNSADFPSIQAALNALPNHGGLVEVPAGIHRIEEPLLIRKSNVTLRGVGRSTVIFNENRGGQPAIIAGSAEDPANNPLWGIIISNMLITGDTASVWKASAWPEENHFLKDGGDGILVDHCYNSLFEKLWIVRNGGNGLNLVVAYEDPRVESCLIAYNGKAGIRMEGVHDICLAGNQIEENYEEGILAIDTYNIAASGNDIDDNRATGVHLREVIGSPFSGNVITNSRQWGVILENSRGNTFAGEIIRRHVGKGGLMMINSSYNTVSGCTFDSNDGPAIVVDSNSTQNSITGNSLSSWVEAATCEGFVIGGRENILSSNIIAPSMGFALVLSGRDQNVFGNTVLGAGRASCIRIRDLNDSIIRDNLLLCRSGSGKAGGGLSYAGSNKGNRIVNNK